MSDWTLIYSTDLNGSVSFGSVNALKLAVIHGADVKILYTPQAGTWWSRSCDSVSARGSGASALVAATYMEAANTKLGTSGIEFEAPFAVEYHIYNSNGVRKLMKNGNVDSRIMPMKWYIKDYQVPWIIHAEAISKYVEHER